MKFFNNSIRNILTIRYDPLEKQEFPSIDETNFLSTKNDPDGFLIENLLKKSLQKIIPSKTKIVNLSLSGGIDSSLTLALLRKIHPSLKIKSICGIFEDGFNESKIAQDIASKFDSDFKIIPIGSLFTNLPEIVSITSQPKWNTYTHLIAKAAKKSGNLLITGDAADEIFAGYVFRYKKFMTLSRPKDSWKIKTLNYLECHNRDWVPDQEKLFGTRINFQWNKI